MWADRPRLSDAPVSPGCGGRSRSHRLNHGIVVVLRVETIRIPVEHHEVLPETNESRVAGVRAGELSSGLSERKRLHRQLVKGGSLDPDRHGLDADTAATRRKHTFEAPPAALDWVAVDFVEPQVSGLAAARAALHEEVAPGRRCALGRGASAHHRYGRSNCQEADTDC